MQLLGTYVPTFSGEVIRYIGEKDFRANHYNRLVTAVCTIATDYRSGFKNTSPLYRHRGRDGAGLHDYDDDGAIVARARDGNRPRKSKAAADIAIGNSAIPRQFARVGHSGIVACVPRSRHSASRT